ncbi:MAG: cytochrome c, partial [Burkholderiaceae bacterium]|nr:cytochrome c [Burkholderiaceae bacterium]
MQRIPKTVVVVLALCLLVALAAAAVVVLNLRGEEALPASPVAVSSDPGQVARGEYLARVGNCMACHTVQGGAPLAGGRGIETPFGVVHSSNLTPDAATGIGRWSSAEFWRALHHGRSKDGRLLYPAFPYPNYTQVTREDSDAIYASLQQQTPVAHPNRPHALRFPYTPQAPLAVWRALFFRPGPPVAEPAQSAEWNRGAYLVQGLGHCAACHTPRNALGGPREAQAFGGGLIPVQNWYAPALNDAREAGVKHWPVEDVVALLKTGLAPQGSVLGPMAEVVFRSTQYLSDADARAMAVYLQALPPPERALPA